MLTQNNGTGNPNIIKNNAYAMTMTSTTMIWFANDEQEAYNMMMPRGYTQAYIFSLNADVFWFKKIDGTGQIIIFDTYDFTKRIPPEPEKPVTHDDLANMQNNILAQISAMLQQNQQINNQSKEDNICG